MTKQKEVRDLKKQLNSIREENQKLKNLSSIVVKNKMTTKIIHFRNRVVLILKSIGNFFTFKSKRIEILSKEIEALEAENKSLQFIYPFQSFRLPLEPSSLNFLNEKKELFNLNKELFNLNINDLKFQKSQRELEREWSRINASYHSQGTVDRAQR